MRDVYLAQIRTRFPGFVPQNDVDLLALGGGSYKGPEEGLRAWLDNELASMVALVGDAQRAIEAAQDILSAPGIVTGLKPQPGDTGEGIFVRQIPRSEYSIRLFPGTPAMREYCLDFVETRTGQPVNSPFKFELWLIGNGTSPHAHGRVRLRSLESAFGYLPQDISPGAEKFVLTDGMTCLLTRPGHKPVRFTVPTRTEAVEPFDGDELDLPERIP
ncbi:hypothetical protein L226DRAFT_526143 [Lentinus tigrinus ALCF2SS1-7]|uniref:Uncharacterized protein n=1 Tax=Lentinus tigrinus ALCF2SS1-6 TaxID=1328759 RepID=A0A5C2RVX0_9APHY|nr:hypothetical protein L227DRAFT_510336 [Lentinus tigrinus ALCF2SS1-6]RPD70112.1 hypothetical protein L226DRAFT_526143 [Lentinus tigrinus ALCF2SS1-7]